MSLRRAAGPAASWVGTNADTPRSVPDAVPSPAAQRPLTIREEARDQRLYRSGRLRQTSLHRGVGGERPHQRFVAAEHGLPGGLPTRDPIGAVHILELGRVDPRVLRPVHRVSDTSRAKRLVEGALELREFVVVDLA